MPVIQPEQLARIMLGSALAMTRLAEVLLDRVDECELQGAITRGLCLPDDEDEPRFEHKLAELRPVFLELQRLHPVRLELARSAEHLRAQLVQLGLDVPPGRPV